MSSRRLGRGRVLNGRILKFFLLVSARSCVFRVQNGGAVCGGFVLRRRFEEELCGTNDPPESERIRIIPGTCVKIHFCVLLPVDFFFLRRFPPHFRRLNYALMA